MHKNGKGKRRRRRRNQINWSMLNRGNENIKKTTRDEEEEE